MQPQRLWIFRSGAPSPSQAPSPPVIREHALGENDVALLSECEEAEARVGDGVNILKQLLLATHLTTHTDTHARALVARPPHAKSSHTCRSTNPETTSGASEGPGGGVTLYLVRDSSIAPPATKPKVSMLFIQRASLLMESVCTLAAAVARRAASAHTSMPCTGVRSGLKLAMFARVAAVVSRGPAVMQTRFHTPSIKFRHGPAAKGASGAHAGAREGVSPFVPAPPTAAAAAPAAPVHHAAAKQWVIPPSKATKQFTDLPPMYGRPGISAAEADAILAGTAL